ncbi:cobalamin B12-binding domain-containing protein [Lentzea kentuckyensis]|uniref:cobalamin B12-binding domain-containing protein n=1 Tax=Lentzea kentuckyensis TaxID=360086 RepID=UPI000A3C3681|nr:cobalamin-dependent protein [Lentzea kentuckyensis]
MIVTTLRPGLVHPAPARPLDVLVTSVSSDAHTWNLVFLQLLVEELRHRVTNLGACVPDDLLVREATRPGRDLVVVSSVNGHGFTDGLRVIERIRRTEELDHVPVVIGGKLGTSGTDDGRADKLMAAGFDGVFEDGSESQRFLSFVDSLPTGICR